MGKDPKNALRLRMENCIGTIIDVHESIKYPDGINAFLPQFEELKKVIIDMDMSAISEVDVLIVEKATNALLWEFRPIFKKGDYGPIYQNIKH